MQAAPYILMAVGTAASMAAERNAAKERRGVINRAMERNDQADEKARQQVVAEGQKFSGQQRLDAMQQQEQSAIAQALQDVGGNANQGAGASIIDTAGGEGAVSGDFIKAKADRAVSEGERMTAVAREMAKVRAPGQLQNAEGLRRSDLMEQLSSMGVDSRARTRAASLDAENVTAPWWGTAGKLAAMAGSAWAAGAGGAGAGAGATGSGQYALSGGGQALGAQPASNFWGNAARIRFGG